ncbi:hotdog fold domain-containing protein [Pseudomonadota bacterium]|uniref:hotdog fold domain-containing protein n=1 Tax=unclassified Shewanella TaxID=196818 RepID=UPI000C851A07|nr:MULTISPECIES: hotdog fold domain-containing protein [unclassified Shewanella]MDO6617419.1 hotdog fold domain-containing protein [Shewanella sp. 6_MG-2023]MDO6638843.1 hotdog fold domain-containing protein [Shewanella sp. 5_MG-2023]MDO6677198.1 hotdog fold domain-containing protein [Shewanella sp. 4_MG-2023]PMG31560.1 thioesterase [Shewanella sp. 10N.286.52.C2]
MSHDKPNHVLALYHKVTKYPFGNKIFSMMVSRTAPYFATVRPLVTALRVNHCAVLVKKRRAVHNHIKTVHVIAICNGLEMAMGVMAEASIPKHLRWIPKGMSVDYTAKAGTDILCVAEVTPEQWQVGDMLVPVNAYDTEGKVVVRGSIKLWISEKPAK